jgi:hypothetical protein
VKRLVLAVAMSGACVVPASAVATGAGTVPPSPAQRSAILKAFGAPRAGWHCLTVRLAASDHRYATVRPPTSKACARWAFNGRNVLKRTGTRWKVLFEGSAYACPLPRIPRQVQRDLRVCV